MSRSSVRRRGLLRSGAEPLLPLTPTFLTSGVSTAAGGGSTLGAAITSYDIMFRFIQARNVGDGAAVITWPSGWTLCSDGTRSAGNNTSSGNLVSACAWAPGGTTIGTCGVSAGSPTAWSEVIVAYNNVDFDHVNGPLLEVRPDSAGGGSSINTAAFTDLPGFDVRLIGATYSRTAAQGVKDVTGMTRRAAVSASAVDNNTVAGDLLASSRGSVTITWDATGTKAAHQLALRPRYA